MKYRPSLIASLVGAALANYPPPVPARAEPLRVEIEPPEPPPDPDHRPYAETATVYPLTASTGDIRTPVYRPPHRYEYCGTAKGTRSKSERNARKLKRRNQRRNRK